MGMDSPSQNEQQDSPFSNWPTLPGKGGRTLFVAGARDIDTTTLRAKGYDVVDVLQLPRTNDGEHHYAIEAWLQGMSEGSIPMDREKRLSLELEARARGLLVNRSMKVDVAVKVSEKSLEELLSGPRAGRFTLNGASARQIERAARAAVTPGVTLNEEDEKN